jgi:hypothetical protein
MYPSRLLSSADEIHIKPYAHMKIENKKILGISQIYNIYINLLGKLNIKIKEIIKNNKKIYR